MVVCFKKTAHSLVELAIQLRTLSKYVHCEFLFSDGVTFRVMGGDHPAVHYERGVVYNTSDWDKVFLDIPEAPIRAWCDMQIGKSYDWLGLLNYIFPFGEDDDDDLYCSEATVLGIQRDGLLRDEVAKKDSPGKVYRLLSTIAKIPRLVKVK